MAGDDVNSIIKLYEYLYSQQANFRTLWNEIAQFVMPAWDNFVGETSEGVRRTYRLFDETAVSANERFAAAIQQMTTPQTQRYHKLASTDEHLSDDSETQQYLDELTKILFAARYRVKANFTSQADECYMSLGAFGNFALFVDEIMGVGLSYRSIPLNELVWALDHVGLVDTVFRKFKFTVKQSMQKWGKSCPKVIQEAFSQNPYKEFEFLHCVQPNPERIRGAVGAKGMMFSSWYIYLGSEKTVMEYRGYRTFPYAIGRYRMAPREHYGRSPASVALPAIRTLNEQKKTLLRAGQKVVDPPILLAEEGVLTAFNQRAGAVNYGMVSDDGKPLAVPFQSGANIQLGAELMQEEKGAINDAFLTTLFQILVQNPNMTATEALIRLQEKGMLIAPAGSRLQSEFLGPLIERELDILHEAGQLPPPPRQLIEAGGRYKVEYLSPLNRAMRAEDATAIMNTAQAVGVLAQLQPSVVHVVDWDAAAREVAEINGLPAKLLLDQETVDHIREQQQEQQQAAGMVAAAPGLSQSALNLAKAAQAGQQPGAVPGSTAPVAATPGA